MADDIHQPSFPAYLPHSQQVSDLADSVSRYLRDLTRTAIISALAAEDNSEPTAVDPSDDRDLHEQPTYEQAAGTDRLTKFRLAKKRARLQSDLAGLGATYRRLVEEDRASGELPSYEEYAPPLSDSKVPDYSPQPLWDVPDGKDSSLSGPGHSLEYDPLTTHMLSRRHDSGFETAQQRLARVLTELKAYDGMEEWAVGRQDILTSVFERRGLGAISTLVTGSVWGPDASTATRRGLWGSMTLPQEGIGEIARRLGLEPLGESGGHRLAASLRRQERWREAYQQEMLERRRERARERHVARLMRTAGSDDGVSNVEATSRSHVNSLFSPPSPSR